ncbi:asparagine synthase (glutamine-hydrolyzing) [Sphingomonas sp. CFBP 13733]|jgi:asparagine synthase (glutamine-hydrolysing)|uniref:asparagine synthase (glutamine-hydrolyzing) n=1 Tax=Sphingomonas sp. CFBP 13733 TaxID=2775291 RepID=UPI001FD54B77|nr:asparagine synthase (glutamine-hydrolyzing) [Sphingomonas sp. CFBP 13733]
MSFCIAAPDGGTYRDAELENQKMCGIAGFVTGRSLNQGARASLVAMTDAIAHRGPDDDGQWVYPEQGVALGHRRLAIIDLSPAGHQPMSSVSGRYVLVYNGEIYNYAELRTKLEQEEQAPTWRGHSDTEVLLACIEAWGIRSTLEQANGMFAFALWDRQDEVLTLARDRAGEKPLFYGWQGGTFLFASELKALTAYPGFERVINRDAAAAMMRFGYVPAPMCIWQGVHKLPPGYLLEVRPKNSEQAVPQCYWDIATIAAHNARHPLIDTPDLVNELDALLRDAVRLRMEADVPLGAFLSGGVDSSMVTALMQAQADRPVRTFSIGFGQRAFDESGYARAVAKHLGTDHCELHVDLADVQATIPKLPMIWDEPFADSSQIPTYLVNLLARREVTVALSGDGGDELFAGYNRHVLGARIWEGSARLPGFMRRGIAGALTSRTASGLVNATGLGNRIAGLSERLPKIGAVIGARDPAEFYAQLVSQWRPGTHPVIGASDGDHVIAVPAFDDFRNTMLFMDTVTYLPDDILTKVDRAGMAVSLEGRIPFLDHRVIEFAWRVPMSAKIRDGRGKHILREVLYRYVPRALIDRPKAGFAIPIGDWLAGPLRDWAEALIEPAALASQGILNPALITRTWTRFLRGEKALVPQLWCVLMFQAWLQAQGSQPVTAALRHTA